jgi:hypothetical protein
MNDSGWDYVGKGCAKTTNFNTVSNRNVLENGVFSGVIFARE